MLVTYFLQPVDEVEETVFNAIISWTNHDLDNRKQFLAVLLEKVDFNKMSATFLKNVVSKNVCIYTSQLVVFLHLGCILLSFLTDTLSPTPQLITFRLLLGTSYRPLLKELLGFSLIAKT